MKFRILDETKGRMRIHIIKHRMSPREADILFYHLKEMEVVEKAKVYERTGDVVIKYHGDRSALTTSLCKFDYERAEAPEDFLCHSGRQLNRDYEEKLVLKIIARYTAKALIPMPIRSVITGLKSVKYLKAGLSHLAKGEIKVPVLDATAIGVSMARMDFGTASSIMFLLGIGELLEEWTHKKSVGDLARSMSLNIDKVWKVNGEQTQLVSATSIREKDLVKVHMGNTVPFDGTVVEGEALINQSTLTGEAAPVRKSVDSYVYAGTVLEEGEILISVKAVGSDRRYSKIVSMIEDSEKLKSSRECQAEHLADRLVPYTLAATGLTYLLTRNVTKALSILMVDFSCALKLAMPISVLSAIREASEYSITVKGGKFLEAIAEADTIVFDKTGTLTEAKPKVVDVVSFCDRSPDELLRIAACMEEHFLHSMAKAVVAHAKDKGLDHNEMHSKVEYVVAHGISTTINGKKAIIGSYHFVFEDEKTKIMAQHKQAFENLPKEFSHLYLAIEGYLAAVILIEDPLRDGIDEIVKSLRNKGFKQIVMMTGDSYRTANSIANSLGINEFYAEVLPEDKADFIKKQREEGHKVVMIGDGVNDSPALSASDVGIAISEGADIAREIADVTIGSDDLKQLLDLRDISTGLVDRIEKNYKKIVIINTTLIILGVGGLVMPTTSALLHNTSTLLIGLDSMTKIIK